jgi:hypothetical protein
MPILAKFGSRRVGFFDITDAPNYKPLNHVLERPLPLQSRNPQSSDQRQKWAQSEATEFFKPAAIPNLRFRLHSDQRR